MDSDTEFERPSATLTARASVFAVHFEDLAKSLIHVGSLAELRALARTLVDFEGHQGDWAKFREEATTDRLAAQSWTEQKEFRKELVRVSAALQVIEHQLTRIKKLLGVR